MLENTAMVNAEIPADFPRGSDPASLAGKFPKLALRLVDGKYVSGYTTEELAERYDGSQDMVKQLTPYVLKKHVENPEWTYDDLHLRMVKGISTKGWGFTDEEVGWILREAMRPLQFTA
jgi:hypothetical protein